MAHQPFTDDELYAAIGRVVDRSAHASIFLDQVASGLAGTDDYFVQADLVDRPLGMQLTAVRRLADGNPGVLDEELTRSCDVLLACLAELVPFRNRIVHDNWMKLRDWSDQEALFGHRPWGRGTTPQIWSSLGTFADLDSAFWSVGWGLNGVGLSLRPLRSGGSPEDDPRGKAQRAAVAVTELHAVLSEQGLPPGWRWDVVNGSRV